MRMRWRKGRSGEEEGWRDVVQWREGKYEQGISQREGGKV
jgi:hypothetical protein